MLVPRWSLMRTVLHLKSFYFHLYKWWARGLKIFFFGGGEGSRHAITILSKGPKLATFADPFNNTIYIREARENNGNLAVLWLDLANTYSSIPHKAVEETLCRYHVPSSLSNLILDYYNNFNLRVTSGTKTSDWHRLERGIITGCTISATLFSLAMNMIIKSAEVEYRGPRAKSGIWQPSLRAYMDDITVTTSSVMGCKWA